MKGLTRLLSMLAPYLAAAEAMTQTEPMTRTESQLRELVEGYLESVIMLPIILEHKVLGKGEAFLLPDKLAVLLPGFNDLLLLSYEGMYDHGGVPDNLFAIGDELLKLEQWIDLKISPELFLQKLTEVKQPEPKLFYILIDGERVLKTGSQRTCTRQRNQYLRERRKGGIDFNHLCVIDPNGQRTDFLFNQKDPGVEAMRAELKDKIIPKSEASGEFWFPK